MTVKQLLQDAGIKQEDLARILKKSQGTVSLILNGRVRMAFDDACIIARILGISLEELREALAEELPQYRIDERLQIEMF